MESHRGHDSFDNIFSEICSRLKAQGEVESTSKRFSSLGKDIERFKFAKSLLDELILNEESDKENAKSESEANRLREAGNEKFRKKLDLEALNLYTQCILRAPQKSKTLALGFGNRSAVLKSLNKFEDCILDIERALNLEFPKSLSYKLLTRKGECFKSIGKPEEAERDFSEAQELLKSADLPIEKLKEQNQLLKNLISSCKNCKSVISLVPEKIIMPPCKSYGQNVEITCASDCVEIKHLPEIGRHLCATRDIEPGDVIIVEEPYAWILLPEFLTSHCSFCLQRSDALIPCPSCSHVMFCGELCLETARTKFHNFECPLLLSILNLDLGKIPLLAVRILSVAGLKFLEKFLPPVIAPVQENCAGRTLGFNSTGEYDSLDLLPIFHLISNTDSRTVSDLFKRSLMAACLVKCLCLGARQDAALLGSFLLRLLQNLPCNAHEVSETVKSKMDSMPMSLEIGAAAYACLSLLNHSCDPNVVRHSYGSTAVLRAIKFISKGQQILDNYGFHFAVHPRKTRQTHLQSQYLFNCDCEACSNGWPLHLDLPSAPQVSGAGAKVVRASSDKVQKIIKRSLDGEELLEEDLNQILCHLKLLDLHGGRLSQEFNCCQEIAKEKFARQGNFYNL